MKFRLSLSILWLFSCIKTYDCENENTNGQSKHLSGPNFVRLDVNISEVTGLDNPLVSIDSPSTLGLMVAIVNTNNQTVCSQEIKDASVEPSVTCQIPLSQVVPGHNQFYVNLYDGQTGEVFGTMDASFYIDTPSPSVASFASPFTLSSSMHPNSKSNHKLLIGLAIVSGTAFGTHKLLALSRSDNKTQSSQLNTINNTKSDGKPPPPPSSWWSSISEAHQLTGWRHVIPTPLNSGRQSSTDYPMPLSRTPKLKRYGMNNTITSANDPAAARTGALSANSPLSSNQKPGGGDRSRFRSSVGLGLSLLAGAAAATVTALSQPNGATVTTTIFTSPVTDSGIRSIVHTGGRDGGVRDGSGGYRRDDIKGNKVYKLSANTSILRALTEHVWKALTTLISRSGT